MNLYLYLSRYEYSFETPTLGMLFYLFMCLLADYKPDYKIAKNSNVY